MRNRDFRLDMTMMYAMHDAVRRDLERITRITERTDDDPRRLLAAAVGWQLFTSYLVVHHTAEDTHVWPVMRRALADRPDDLALLDAMEAEHGVIDPLLADIEVALADRAAGAERLAERVDTLRGLLGGHLAHEERDALELIDATLTDAQWAVFGQDHGRRVGADRVRYLPWILDGASPDRTAAVLTGLPAPLRDAYRNDWQPAYAGLPLWPR
jgi:hemerythrin-like domain-containing protein